VQAGFFALIRRYYAGLYAIQRDRLADASALYAVSGKAFHIAGSARPQQAVVLKARKRSS